MVKGSTNHSVAKNIAARTPQARNRPSFHIINNVGLNSERF